MTETGKQRSKQERQQQHSTMRSVNERKTLNIIDRRGSGLLVFLWFCFLLCCNFVVSTSDHDDDGNSNNSENHAAGIHNKNNYPSSSFSVHRKLAAENNDDAAFQKLLQSHNDHLKQSDDPVVKVLGPTYFPEPTPRLGNDVNVVPNLKPALGAHRKDHDAVVAYASEYKLQNYVVFIESLRRTGYKGDIVLSVTQADIQKKDIHDYLSNAEGVVVYAPEHVCFNFEGEVVDNAKGGMRTCVLNNLWGKKDKDGNVTPIHDDPRPQRTLATARYEIYWLIIINYNPNSWILVVDARDTYFQSDPFKDVPRNTDKSGQSGLLYYFGENIEATRLGLSPQNSKWLNSAYGDAVAKSLKDKPTICSGASMGEQIAMESYVRAMVSEADETGTILMGADQGFHNFMYYSGKLMNSKRIHDIVVFDQGTGIVNNMGALRTKALKDWGNGKIVKEIPGDKGAYQVLNWDGTISPVVHQFDRHKELNKYFLKRKGEEFLKALKS